MTIKEIEELTGMTRANIRFYEAEGFINPARNSNGYRDYSHHEVDVLKKIKLLRSLHISLEEIKELHAGSHNLLDTLNIHIKQLATQKKDLDNASKICYSMKQDGVSYQTLNTEKYLNAFTDITDTAPEELTHDTIPPVSAPWRRFFARTLDEIFYSFIWHIILILVFKENLANWRNISHFLNTAICLVLTFFLEPLQLTLLGTTLGKFILGLSVRDNNDRKLTYKDAQARTSQVLWHGCGLHLPIYSLYRYWKSYNTCTCHDTLPWEYESTLILKDEKSWRIACYLVIHVFIYSTIVLSTLYIQNPPNRGELTVEEFCHNYRYLEDYYGLEGSKELNDRGEWRNRFEPGNYNINIYVDHLFTLEDKRAFRFNTDSDGHINSISFVLEYNAVADDDHPVWLPSCQEQMILSALAFIGAQDDFGLFSNNRKKLVEQISTQTFQDFQFTFTDVTVTCDYEYKGLAPAAPSSSIIFPKENEDIYYYLYFSLEK